MKSDLTFQVWEDAFSSRPIPDDIWAMAQAASEAVPARLQNVRHKVRDAMLLEWAKKSRND